METQVKQRIKNGWEYDWVSKVWRRFMGWRSGQGKYIKRCLNKRVRQEGKQQARGEE